MVAMTDLCRRWLCSLGITFVKPRSSWFNNVSQNDIMDNLIVPNGQKDSPEYRVASVKVRSEYVMHALERPSRGLEQCYLINTYDVRALAPMAAEYLCRDIDVRIKSFNLCMKN